MELFITFVYVVWFIFLGSVLALYHQGRESFDEALWYTGMGEPRMRQERMRLQYLQWILQGLVALSTVCFLFDFALTGSALHLYALIIQYGAVFAYQAYATYCTKCRIARQQSSLGGLDGMIRQLNARNALAAEEERTKLSQILLSLPGRFYVPSSPKQYTRAQLRFIYAVQMALMFVIHGGFVGSLFFLYGQAFRSWLAPLYSTLSTHLQVGLFGCGVVLAACMLTRAWWLKKKWEVDVSYLFVSRKQYIRTMYG